MKYESTLLRWDVLRCAYGKVIFKGEQMHVRIWSHGPSISLVCICWVRLRFFHLYEGCPRSSQKKPEMFQDDIGYWHNFACLHIHVFSKLWIFINYYTGHYHRNCSHGNPTPKYTEHFDIYSHYIGKNAYNEGKFAWRVLFFILCKTYFLPYRYMYTNLWHN